MTHEKHNGRTICCTTHPGQIMPLTAIIFPVLVLFIFVMVEIADRWLTVAMLENALQSATRSATVQQLDYSRLAEGKAFLAASADCVNVTKAAAVGGPCEAVITTADSYLRINLQGVRRLAGANSATAITAAAHSVLWTVRPQGGGCSYSSGQTVPDEATPLICAEMRPTVEGFVLRGPYQPLIIAADRLDVGR